MTTFLHIGGLIAAGFDPTGAYLLAISHNGRGVFDTRHWKRVARDPSPAYPAAGVAMGIGPIDRQTIPVVEMNYDNESFELRSPDGKVHLNCESDGIIISPIQS